VKALTRSLTGRFALAAEPLEPAVASLPRGSLPSPLGPSEVSFLSTSRRSATRSPFASYEVLDRFPEGLLVVGDALASFNPIYAQGVTVAAFEALVLHHALADGVDDLATRFFGAAASVVDTAWSLGVGPDFEFPGTEGRRPSGGRAAGWYVSRLRRRARSGPVLREVLARIIHFERPPSSLFHPRVMWRLLSPVTGWFHTAEPESNTAGVTVPPNEEWGSLPAERPDGAGDVLHSPLLTLDAAIAHSYRDCIHRALYLSHW